ncbi:aaRS-interacting multifunctional protein 1 isoform X1 [Rhodnius prolixus]|uniref:tRNA-binding domain-containing protein n=2 Tax=Rhodnius prolixus TaxID=13249 RepID=T1I761_RHOPR
MNFENNQAMNKFNEIVCASEEIDTAVKTLSDEMSSLEELSWKKNKINTLKKENEELHRLIVHFKKELCDLEIANGKKQIQSAIKIPVKEVTLQGKCAKKEPATLILSNKPTDVTSNKKIQKKDIQKEEKTISKEGSSKRMVAGEEVLPIDIGRLDLKVGRILDIQRHKDADTLFVEKVDVGAKEPITVVSGLVKHIPIEELENRLVVVLCNLKPAKMRGVTSEGMVMCACTTDRVEVLSPSPTCKPGDLVTVPGYPSPPNGPEPVLNPKKKIFETLAPELLTDSEGFATYRGVRWEVPGGYVKSATLFGVNIK